MKNLRSFEIGFPKIEFMAQFFQIYLINIASITQIHGNVTVCIHETLSGNWEPLVLDASDSQRQSFHLLCAQISDFTMHCICTYSIHFCRQQCHLVCAWAMSATLDAQAQLKVSLAKGPLTPQTFNDLVIHHFCVFNLPFVPVVFFQCLCSCLQCSHLTQICHMHSLSLKMILPPFLDWCNNRQHAFGSFS